MVHLVLSIADHTVVPFQQVGESATIYVSSLYYLFLNYWDGNRMSQRINGWVPRWCCDTLPYFNSAGCSTISVLLQCTCALLQAIR